MDLFHPPVKGWGHTYCLLVREEEVFSVAFTEYARWLCDVYLYGLV